MEAEFWFGCAMGSLATLAAIFVWCMLTLRRPTDFDQYEVE